MFKYLGIVYRYDILPMALEQMKLNQFWLQLYFRTVRIVRYELFSS